MPVVLRSALALACAFAAPLTCAAQDTSSCDAPFETVLRAAPGAMAARAVWRDGQHLQWPGLDGRGQVALYYAPEGGIQAPPGGSVSGAAGRIVLQPAQADTNARWRYLEAGPVYAVPADADMRSLHRGQLVLVQEVDGKVAAATRIQAAGALDALFATDAPLGAQPGPNGTRFAVWAPTARAVHLCVYDSGSSAASARLPMVRDSASGVWQAESRHNLSGKYYLYQVEVVVDGVGLVRNLVPDPYAVSASADSARAYIADLDAPALKPAGWDQQRAPDSVHHNTDMAIYELHVRDFSINDPSVPEAHRGKYLAFTDTASNGMRHLRALRQAGLTDIHLLPIFDFGSVPEARCVTPTPHGPADGEQQQAISQLVRERDCFNWGYDPVLYSAPEGSYASDPMDGARRIRELRAMVQALHQAGLRVGMDVVYNHTFIAGQDPKSILDRIVPGYYHRLNAAGAIERSTCCDNTATENRMMARLMIDSVALWAKAYRIDSFRFDLMGHQPRAAMEALQARVNQAAGRPVQLIGEGWNFGEVADGRRFEQASQLSLNGSGIGSFSDRARDAVRGGGAGDSGRSMFERQGYINGLGYDPNGYSQAGRAALLQAADLVRVGLAGTVRSYPLTTYTGAAKRLEQIDYAGQPAGFASAPGEAVNYVENHDNQTLYDINAIKLPLATPASERARVQALGMAINAFSQGVAYFHAGIDTLRSKSLDRNSFNSGDWFNRIDWSYRTNYFGSGLPQHDDNGKDWPLLRPLLTQAQIRPAPADIAFARDVFRDLLAIRASSTLFRLRTADEITRRLRFHNTGPQQEATVIAATLDGRGYPGAHYARISYFINVDKTAHTLEIGELAGKAYRLHPAQRADARVRQARYEQATGRFTIPARTAVVFVE
ncbi:alpha-1,6-glucosidase domain-containing protein [Massilia sp. TS11]|uniref:alpha-1,6-glucosidase domain-containing protein n=1 Tax=Massilia sp. TS11 TaxID=2908003 RepID=UPI001EDA8E91|nr:alpha-1,6-glucosidase domain-containing protein [Massilia sp. TS11]MCG2583752.1 DUF3372 domain-containing protein [Massilia sp. TS11]